MSYFTRTTTFLQAQMLTLPYKHRNDSVHSHKVQLSELVVPTGCNPLPYILKNT